ncbi:MAG: hypothetical protein ACLSGF_01335 [Alistipes onderdonkii]
MNDWLKQWISETTEEDTKEIELYKKPSGNTSNIKRGISSALRLEEENGDLDALY